MNSEKLTELVLLTVFGFVIGIMTFILVPELFGFTRAQEPTEPVMKPNVSVEVIMLPDGVKLYWFRLPDNTECMVRASDGPTDCNWR